MLIKMITLLGKLKCLKTVFLIQLPWFKQQLDTLLILSFTNKLMCCNGKISIFNHSRNLFASLLTNCDIYVTIPSKKFRNNLLMTSRIKNPSHQESSSNINFTKEEESNSKLEFLETLLKRNNGKICHGIQETYTYWPIRTLQLSSPNKFQGKCSFFLV